MGSRDWFKTIIGRKKTKHDQSKQVKGSSGERSNGSKWRNQSNEASNKLYNGTISGKSGDFGMTVEDRAATWIQTAFRSFMARKALRHLKRARRLNAINQRHFVKMQTSTTLRYLQSWNKIQTEIRARHASMVSEGRIRQKNQDNQLKLEAKLHDLEVEWCGGSETMEEIIARIHHRESAAVKRERTMAYAFSHQWRANSGLNQGQPDYEFGKGTWGWSWMDRWIAARPWETRLPTLPQQPKSQPKAVTKSGKNTGASAHSLSNPDPTTDDKKATQKPGLEIVPSSHPGTK